ncbi:hypothetical protein AGABI1DRAFT_109955 [Agaricus bisporus var. burnettii JB137-S8]|uniref:Uncharacterized protein n=1 Tax=Agaricus bisporus var. burnettii (strain JB137-S8 / ATCC MYA-4627 / FGSC 10392) TaxID=597362 RepID=K5WV16_AGABU|nr:uncharacterized protein AGABI1DRAFT_109955 [Agaricus bisporus var. burnettii JB137-S8]EKM74417.1 hypothetical protein AGABI1DRAFT_109955 [Agaricus bisporus var. burnettii JB137-S8]
MSIAECPRCGYHLATELKEEVSTLGAEVRRLEDLIPRLQEEKAVLLRRINNAQERTRHLPFEVLSNIFLFARPPIDFTAHEPRYYHFDDPDYPPLTGHFDPDEDFHHTLAAVSHRWRQVALSTPQLWTSISLHVLNTFTDFNTSLLDLYFKNARNLPVSVQMDFSNPALVWEKIPPRRSDFLTRLEPLAEFIFDENADKVQSLSLIRPPAEWFYSTRSNFPHCDSVTIYWLTPEDESNFFYDFEEFTSLHQVKLSGSGLTFTLPASVSALQLSQTDLTGCLESLARSPNLIRLDITNAWTTAFSSALFNVAIKPIVLHRLEILTWSEMVVDVNHDFLRYARFVNLTTLEWDEYRTYYHRLVSDEGKRLRLAFFSSLPSTLSSLTFNYLDIDSPSLVNLLYCIPQLTKLYLTRCPREVVVGAIKAIGRPPANRVESSLPSNVLPNLCALSILDTRSRVLDALVFIEMLESLHAAGPQQKQFLLNTNSDVDWPSDALGEVQALLLSGMDVKITFTHGDSTFSVPSG